MVASGRTASPASEENSRHRYRRGSLRGATKVILSCAALHRKMLGMLHSRSQPLCNSKTLPCSWYCKGRLSKMPTQVHATWPVPMSQISSGQVYTESVYTTYATRSYRCTHYPKSARGFARAIEPSSSSDSGTSTARLQRGISKA